MSAPAWYCPPWKGLGSCRGCNGPVSGRRVTWCSDACVREWLNTHDWKLARASALARDGFRCVRCGVDGVELQIDHIDPRNGEGYGSGCWNHLSNLQTLCLVCHVIAGVVRRHVAAALAAAQRLALPPGPVRQPDTIVAQMDLWAAA